MESLTDEAFSNNLGVEKGGEKAGCYSNPK